MSIDPYYQDAVHRFFDFPAGILYLIHPCRRGIGDDNEPL